MKELFKTENLIFYPSFFFLPLKKCHFSFLIVFPFAPTISSEGTDKQTKEWPKRSIPDHRTPRVPAVALLTYQAARITAVTTTTITLLQQSLPCSLLNFTSMNPQWKPSIQTSSFLLGIPHITFHPPTPRPPARVTARRLPPPHPRRVSRALLRERRRMVPHRRHQLAPTMVVVVVRQRLLALTEPLGATRSNGKEFSGSTYTAQTSVASTQLFPSNFRMSRSSYASSPRAPCSSRWTQRRESL